MQRFGSTTKATRTPSKKATRTFSNDVLTMYKKAPNQEITLPEFEKLAYKRLKVLKKAEIYREDQKMDYNQKFPNATKLMEFMKEVGLNNRNEDVTSHFILRLGYCKTEELRRWFRTQEIEVFKCRYMLASEREKQKFVEENKLGFEGTYTSNFNNDIRDSLNAFGRLRDYYFLVPFKEALFFVKKRLVYLENGIAYIPPDFLLTLLVTKFSKYLALQLSVMCRASQNMRFDKRVRPLVNNLSRQHIGPTYNVTESGTMTKEQIPGLAATSFPLCMRHLYGHLKKDHHLKHGGRMQFGLFIKGIGLSMKDALIFWQQHFAKRTPADAFHKKYAYNIRHNYGKEGKRTSYTPYSCMKIIQMSPGPEDYNGCPYRLEISKLRETLVRQKLPLRKVQEIAELAKNKHYQIACQRFFRATHDDYEGESIGNHPNQYFDESQEYLLTKQSAKMPLTT